MASSCMVTTSIIKDNFGGEKVKKCRLQQLQKLTHDNILYLAISVSLALFLIKLDRNLRSYDQYLRGQKQNNLKSTRQRL